MSNAKVVNKSIWSVGRRKTAVAQVRAVPNGSGKITVNHKPVDKFFAGLVNQTDAVQAPIKVAEDAGKAYDYFIKVSGGGITGQAEAARHGIARALATVDEKLKKAMRVNGFLTRDDRMVERKKPGQPKARKKFQFSKR